HPQTLKDPHFSGSAGDQMKGVDAASLADAINAAHSLLEPHRIPRQFEVHDDPAVVVQVEPFAGSVGRQQHAALFEGDYRRSTLLARKPSVKDRGVWCDAIANMP